MNTNIIANNDNNFSKNILILGGADGIGFAISKVYEKLNYNIYVTSRNKHKDSNNIKYFILEATKENSWLDLKEKFNKDNIVFDIILNTIGILHDEVNNIYPEKSIKNMDINFFMKNMEINSLVSALCIKHMIEFISKNNRTVIASLTARLGSISDNNIGGWLSYRASKAAQHMIIKTASIEFSRNYNNLIIIGLHPGTVSTKLSKPYIKSAKNVFEPKYSARKLVSVIEKLDYTSTGKVFDYSGKIIPY
tara:strand:- start:223 stop:972 length:750 start_codon:yes stop_codon:yes gene_type:complete